MDCFRAKEEGRPVVVVAVADNVYTGKVAEGFPTELMRNFVGIRNKITNKVWNAVAIACGTVKDWKHFVVEYELVHNLFV